MKHTFITLSATLLLAGFAVASPIHAQISSTITFQNHKHSFAVEPSLKFIGDTVINITSAEPGDTATAFCPMINIGDAEGIINNIVQSDTTDFIHLIGTRSDGGTWDPTKQLQPLFMGDTAIVSIQYPVPTGTNDTVIDTLTAFTIGPNGTPDTIGNPVTITVITHSSSAVSFSNKNNSSLSALIIPMDGGHALEVILPDDMIDPDNFELVNALGKSVLRTAFSGGSHTIDAGELPRGVYFYRLTAGGVSQSGKVILGE